MPRGGPALVPFAVPAAPPLVPVAPFAALCVPAVAAKPSPAPPLRTPMPEVRAVPLLRAPATDVVLAATLAAAPGRPTAVLPAGAPATATRVPAVPAGTLVAVAGAP